MIYAHNIVGKTFIVVHSWWAAEIKPPHLMKYNEIFVVIDTERMGDRVIITCLHADGLRKHFISNIQRNIQDGWLRELE